MPNTPNLDLEEPVAGTANWDTPNNSNFSKIDAGVLLNNPVADQTIAAGHQLINLGNEQVGNLLANFTDPDITAAAYDPVDTAISAGRIGPGSLGFGLTAVQALVQGDNGYAVNALAAGAQCGAVYAQADGQRAYGVNAQVFGDGTNGETPTGIFADVGSATSSGSATPYGISTFSHYASTANSIGGPVGAYFQGAATPSVGTSIASVVGSQSRVQNLGAGTVTYATHFSTLAANVNLGGGTVTVNYGYDVIAAETIGTTNAAFHTVTQGSGASNYAFYSEGGRFRIDNTPVPATAASAGTPGQIAWDSGFIYVCISSNTWKRVAIATW